SSVYFSFDQGGPEKTKGARRTCSSPDLSHSANQLLGHRLASPAIS
ncbi:hypothetical protein ANCCAN_29771, partial [Ancylostoma caninum]